MASWSLPRSAVASLFASSWAVSKSGTDNSSVVGAHRRERSEYVIAPLPPVSTALIKRSDSASLNPKLRQS